MSAARVKKHLQVQRADHTTIRYTASGPADGPTVVLIHGWACNRSDFDAVTDHLTDDYRVLAVDLAEHGESRSTRDVWTMEEFAHDVAAVLEAESVDTAVVAGHSLGGAVAVEVGRLLSDTVTHVVAHLSVSLPGTGHAADGRDGADVPCGLRRGGAGPGRGRLTGRLRPGSQGRLLPEDGRRPAACRSALHRGPGALGHGRGPARDKAADHRVRDRHREVPDRPDRRVGTACTFTRP
ncbi:alpha/beta fold hydrolase [Streptomyces spiralis]|uniref:alpha/beta fold hydrolase n=1 Tax=Streptomyces spiralis TaxID=66376 RepID=UPI00335A9AA5